MRYHRWSRVVFTLPKPRTKTQVAQLASQSNIPAAAGRIHLHAEAYGESLTEPAGVHALVCRVGVTAASADF